MIQNTKVDILKNLSQSVIDGDVETAKKLSKIVIENNIPSIEAINEGLSKGVEAMGDRFGKGDIFLPELILSSDAMNAGLEILLSNLKTGEKIERKGKIVLGTVKGDVHEIGKNIVAALLASKGFEIIDLGTDVDPKEFLNKARETGADMIGMSSLMTTSRIYQKDTIKLAEDMGIRDKYYLLVGGGVIDPPWVVEIKSDGYGKMAPDAVKLCEMLMKEKPQTPIKIPLIVE